MSKMDRRKLLKLGAVSGAALAVPAIAVAGEAPRTLDIAAPIFWDIWNGMYCVNDRPWGECAEATLKLVAASYLPGEGQSGVAYPVFCYCACGWDLRASDGHWLRDTRYDFRRLLALDTVEFTGVFFPLAGFFDDQLGAADQGEQVAGLVQKLPLDASVVAWLKRV